MSASNVTKTKRIIVLLYDEWDPIGVKAAGAPTDHYKRYAHEIMAKWDANPDIAKIHEFLQHAFIRCLGEPEADPTASRSVAHKIYEILKTDV